MKVLITGANGFIGKNLQAHLAQRKDIKVLCFSFKDDRSILHRLLKDVDFVFHLAGINRPSDPEFFRDNLICTQSLCDEIEKSERKIPIIYTSSIQAELNNDYGISKKDAEEALFSFRKKYANPVHIFRLANVFGKWSKPNYNSVVATFCHNISHGIPLQIDNPDTLLTLVYVDDLIQQFIRLIDGGGSKPNLLGFEEVSSKFTITLKNLADQISAFKKSRSSLIVERVGAGLVRALYATYISYLPVSEFKYEVPVFKDTRGSFAEILKTPDCGQFSFFTAYPGVTRGVHFHHSKTEKFLVVKGNAHFCFRHLITDERLDLFSNGSKPEIIESVPGWSHSITNVGDEEMIVILWANEIYNKLNPDTFSSSL